MKCFRYKSVRISLCLQIMMLIFSLNEIPAAADENRAQNIPVDSSRNALNLKPDSCSELTAFFKERENELSREIRQIKREIIMLRQTLEKPGAKEFFGGIPA